MNTKLQSKLDKWESKTERYKASISRLEMKSQAYENRQDRPLKSYTVVMYGSHDSITGENTANFRLDSSVTAKSQYEKDKPRGLLHKLDAHIKTENIGFVVPVIKKDNNNPIGTNGAINSNAGRRRIVLQNKALPTVLQDAIPYTKRTLLAAENAVIKVGDSFKHTAQPVAMAASNALKMQVSNQIYKAAQDNTGLKAVTGAANAGISTAQTLHKWSSNRRQYMTAQKGLKLEQKTELMKAKVEKLEMKSAVAKEKHVYKELRKSAKENGVDLKFSRAEKKKAWKKVFDNNNNQFVNKPELNLKAQRDTLKAEKKEFKSEKKEYFKSKNEKNAGALKASEDKFNASKEKYSNAKDSFKAQKKKAKKINRLESKEFNEAKKVYHTKLVKETYFNTATGKTQTKYHRVVDKTRKRVQKPKKPDDLFISVSKMGLGALGNKVTMELANSDDVGTQALGKGLQFGMSELSKASQRKAMQSKLKFDKKMEKAQMKMEKAHNQLQIEKSKTEKPKPKKKDKKAMKKAATKNRNAKQFKENFKKKAKALKDKAVAKAKEFVKKKMLPALIGVGGAVFIILLVIMLPILLLGGNTDTGAVLGVAAYTTDREGLIDFNDDVNELYWKWQSEINNKMNSLSSSDTQKWVLKTNACSGGPLSNCPNMTSEPYVEDPNNNYVVKKHLYKGEKISLSSYDIMCLYAYFTVKYRDEDWASFSSEFSSFFNNNFELACKEEYGDIVSNEIKTQVLDVHHSIDCEVTTTKVNGKEIPSHSHTTESEDHEVETTKIIMYYFLYPKDEENPMTIQKYIAEQIKGIGKVYEDGQSEGEKHYEMLMKSLGLCQVIDYPVYNSDTNEIVEWSNLSRKFGSFGVVEDITNYDLEGAQADYRYTLNEQNDVNITINANQLDAVAGGKGKIKSKSSDTIEIEYPDDKLVITYSCTSVDGWGNIYSNSPSGMTSLSVGDEVMTGTHLFYSDKTASGNSPGVQITAYCTETNSYINPLLVVKSKEY